MPAGVSGNQPNDALMAARFSLTTPIDTHLLVSTLQQTGITYASAQQFSQGQAVTHAADRMTLARLLSELLKSSGTLV